MERRIMLALLAAAAVPAARAEAGLWSLLQSGGQVVLVRHALTDPGVGDPEGMSLSDCTTQRNLSEQGRREAERLGEALRQRRGRRSRWRSCASWCGPSTAATSSW